MKNLSSDLIILIPVFVGLLLLAIDLVMRRKIQSEDFKFRKAQFEEEKKEREENRKWLNERKEGLTRVSAELSEYISQNLKKDTSWAADALEKAKIGMQTQTLFGERREHFREEKEYIATQFLPILIDRCKYLITKEKKIVYLIIDSGTTLYPFFEKIGASSVSAFGTKEEWIDNIKLVTNNLVGVQELMESGRINPKDRFSRLGIETILLPGKPLPIYLAVTGQMTENALIQLRGDAVETKDSGREPYFIGITTGNWIRLRRSQPPCPIPLARGDGHLAFKQTLIENSDETYVISPLGKIFVNKSLAEVNESLGFEHSPENRSYDEIRINDTKAASVFLVSTSRHDGRVLSKLSTIVKTALEVENGNGVCTETGHMDSCKPKHFLFPFDKLNDQWHLQIEQEFPHEKTRVPGFYEKYFYVHSESVSKFK